MEINAMNHEHAFNTQASVRYLLKEMSDKECSAFEAHYIDCRACSDEVQFGLDVAEVIHDFPKTDAVPEPRPSIMAQIIASFRQPAFAGAFAMLLLTGGFSLYQRNVIAELKEPRLEARSVIGGQFRKPGDAESIRTSRKSELSLAVRLESKVHYASYMAEIKTASGQVQYSLVAPGGEIDDRLPIMVHADSLLPGKYSIVVWGMAEDGHRIEVGGGAFELTFID